MGDMRHHDCVHDHDHDDDDDDDVSNGDGDDDDDDGYNDAGNSDGESVDGVAMVLIKVCFSREIMVVTLNTVKAIFLFL